MTILPLKRGCPTEISCKRLRTFPPNTKPPPRGFEAGSPAPLGPRARESSPSSSPDSLGLQDHQRPLSKGTEPHAVDADLALGDRAGGRASCRKEEAVTARIAQGSRASPDPRASLPPTASPFPRLLADAPDIAALCTLRESRGSRSGLQATREARGHF